MKRRDMVELLALAPVAAAFSWNEDDAERARGLAAASRESGAQFTPEFFTEHEYATVRVLVDFIIPHDDRSGSATDAAVPEFMDFIMTDQAGRQTAMRGGLAWLDAECLERFDLAFVDGSTEHQTAVLDDIAWPGRARPEHSHGVAFFNSFRDLTASGFWSSKTGVEDLRYVGNTFVREWTGCPEEQLRKLGVSYGE